MEEDIHPAAEPGKIWVHTIDDQNRIRLHKDVSAHLKGLKAVDGWSDVFIGRLGGYGQLIVVSNELDEPAYRKISELLLKNPLKVSEQQTAAAEISRYLATAFPIRCAFEAKTRFVLALPREARELGIVPAAGQIAVVFNTGDLFEIWSGHAWMQYVSKINSGLGRTVTSALGEIESRD